MSVTTEGTRAERTQTVRISEGMLFHLTKYADENSLSISEAMREMVTAYSEGNIPPVQRQPNHERISVWINPSVWDKFRAQAAKDKITQAEAIDAAMRSLL